MFKIDLDTMAKISVNLHTIISENLYAPGGDPGYTNLYSAALAYKTLKMLNIPVDDESGVINYLSEDNICEEDFLKEI